jgi:acyl dehydratase
MRPPLDIIDKSSYGVMEQMQSKLGPPAGHSSTVHVDGVDALEPWLGRSLGSSRWVTVDQPSVDDFGRVTHDLNPLHMSDSTALAFGLDGTIVHGFFSLSLVGGLLADVLQVHHEGLVLNYGLNRVRFPAALPVGHRARLQVSVADVRKSAGWTDVTYACTVEAEGVSRPVCVADMILRYLPNRLAPAEHGVKA